jgi:hypothetical protein
VFALRCARRRHKELTRGCRRFIGVSDLASVRFSLPAQLLEPRPNLGTFDTHGARRRHGEATLGRQGLTDCRVLALSGQARHIHQVSATGGTRSGRANADGRSIGDSDEDLGRMLGCLRFWFTKDLVRCTRLGEECDADSGAEIRQGQAMQALQLDAGRILPGT